MALPALHATKTLAGYLAVAGEVDLDELMGSLRGAGRTVCVPAFDPERGCYAMARVSDDTRYIAAPFGLREPEAPVWIDPCALDCMIVPGVAFGADGGRVGHGGGHYDRMLSATAALRIGVAFDFQVFDEVPMEPHDIPMDCVVTPTRTLFAPRTRATAEPAGETIRRCIRVDY
jgi:5-formyltetrahydrofolate cyclo-ligase